MKPCSSKAGNAILTLTLSKASMLHQHLCWSVVHCSYFSSKHLCMGAFISFFCCLVRDGTNICKMIVIVCKLSLWVLCEFSLQQYVKNVLQWLMAVICVQICVCEFAGWLPWTTPLKLSASKGSAASLPRVWCEAYMYDIIKLSINEKQGLKYRFLPL